MVTLYDLREAQYRHARHYLEQLRVANELYRGGGDRVWKSLSQFQNDWEQIECGQSWVAQHRNNAIAANLCSEYPLAGSDVLQLRHTIAGRIEWLQAALNAAIEFDLLRPQCAHLCALGRACWEAGKVEQAKDYLERALALAEDIDDPANLAQAHYQLGDIAEKQSDLAAANHHTQTCLDLYTALNDRRGIASAMQQLARIHAFESNYTEAERSVQQSLEQFRAIGDHQGAASALTQLGVLAGNQQKIALAEQYYMESYDIYHKLGDLSGEGQTLRLLGVCATFQGNYPLARQRYKESLALYQRLGHQHSIGAVHRKLGENYQYSGEKEQALVHYKLALAIFRSLETANDVADTLLCMGNTMAFGQIEQATQWMLEARNIYRELGNQRMLAASLGLLGSWASERGEFHQAGAYFTEGFAAAQVGGDPWITASITFDWSKLERLRGAFDKAREYWCQAFELAVGFHSPGMLLEGMEYLVNILVPTGELELAYELAFFVTEHPSAIESVKEKVTIVLAQLEEQLPEDVRQGAIARAQSNNLDTYCVLLLSKCETWGERR